MKEINVEYFGSKGLASDGANTIMFSILGADQSLDIEKDLTNYDRFMVVGDRLKYLGYTVATHGDDNLFPSRVKHYIDSNPILPEMIKKQVRIIYGQSYGLYFIDETDDKRIKKWVSKRYPQVFNWLNSWEKDPELGSFKNYISKIAHEYYYMEGYYDQWLFNKSRRTGGNMPVRGLKSKNGVLCRLATTKNIDVRSRLLDSDCDIVLEGDWRRIFKFELDEFPRFDVSNPLKYSTAVNYVRDCGFDEDIYSYTTFFNGQKEWIKGSNLNPKYVNSYLKNSFNAKIHVIIPDAWINEKKNTLEKLCEQNDRRKDEGKKLIEEYEGVKIGTEFNHGMLTALINNKIKECVSVMSGQGENQGKMFWTRSFLTEHGIENWKFEEIPSKYKEFVESIISFNKSSNMMILAGKGLPPSVSNLSNEGVFNSGSEIFYAYMVYLDTLQYPEDYIFEDINRALWINFPELEKAGVKLGFYRSAPPRQEEISPKNRMENNNQNPKQ